MLAKNNASIIPEPFCISFKPPIYEVALAHLKTHRTFLFPCPQPASVNNKNKEKSLKITYLFSTGDRRELEVGNKHSL